MGYISSVAIKYYLLNMQIYSMPHFLQNYHMKTSHLHKAVPCFCFLPLGPDGARLSVWGLDCYNKCLG